MVDKFKQIIRESCKNVRAQLSRSYQAEASSQVCKRISELTNFRKAKRIALYQAVNGEIDLSDIWNSAPLQGKYCYFPVITEALSLIFLPATPKTPFKKNQFGIEEPDVHWDLAIPPEELDIIFLPLVAFDKQGVRIGMGKGYYDRTLHNKPHQALIGVAYEFQKQSMITPDPWDVALTTIVTERAVYPEQRDAVP